MDITFVLIRIIKKILKNIVEKMPHIRYVKIIPDDSQMCKIKQRQLMIFNNFELTWSWSVEIIIRMVRRQEVPKVMITIDSSISEKPKKMPFKLASDIAQFQYITICVYQIIESVAIQSNLYKSYQSTTKTQAKYEKKVV